MSTSVRRLLSIVLVLALASSVIVVTAQRPTYVFDEYDLLSAEQEQQIDDYLYDVDVQTTCEIVIVIESYTDPYPTIFDMALDYFENVPLDGRTGIGKADKDNGVLLIMTMKDGDSYIMTGYGVEGDLTDAECGRILDNILIPHLDEWEDYEAVMYSAEAIAEELGYETEPVSTEDPPVVIQPNTPGIPKSALYIVLVAILIMALFMPVTTRYEDNKWVWERRL